MLNNVSKYILFNMHDIVIITITAARSLSVWPG